MKTGMVFSIVMYVCVCDVGEAIWTGDCEQELPFTHGPSLQELNNLWARVSPDMSVEGDVQMTRYEVC